MEKAQNSKNAQHSRNSLAVPKSLGFEKKRLLETMTTKQRSAEFRLQC